MSHTFVSPPAVDRIPTFEEVWSEMTGHLSLEWHTCNAFPYIAEVLRRKPRK